MRLHFRLCKMQVFSWRGSNKVDHKVMIRDQYITTSYQHIYWHPSKFLFVLSKPCVNWIVTYRVSQKNCNPISYLKTIQNILMTLLDGSQVSDRCPLGYLFFLSNLQTLNFSSHFSQQLWGLEDWILVHTWTVGRYIVYTGIRLLLICPFISSFFILSNYQTLTIVIIFSQKLRRLESWNLDARCMYRVYIG